MFHHKAVSLFITAAFILGACYHDRTARVQNKRICIAVQGCFHLCTLTCIGQNAHEPYSLFILPFWPLSFICFVTCFNCYPVIRKHVIQPYYDQRGESNPEFAYKNADPDEQLFEDRAAEETPVKTKESRKKGKTIS